MVSGIIMEKFVPAKAFKDQLVLKFKQKTIQLLFIYSSPEKNTDEVKFRIVGGPTVLFVPALLVGSLKVSLKIT